MYSCIIIEVQLFSRGVRIASQLVVVSSSPGKMLTQDDRRHHPASPLETFIPLSFSLYTADRTNTTNMLSLKLSAELVG